MSVVEFILAAIPQFCFGYPFVMAWYWMAGGLIYYFVHERYLPPVTHPPPIDHWPPISILVPCYNESDNAEETLRAAAAVDYPDFEVIAINDGSRGIWPTRRSSTSAVSSRLPSLMAMTSKSG